jgi:hypothetical protein
LTTADVENGRYIRLREIRRLQEAGRLNEGLHWVTEHAGTAVGA